MEEEVITRAARAEIEEMKRLSIEDATRRAEEAADTAYVNQKMSDIEYIDDYKNSTEHREMMDFINGTDTDMQPYINEHGMTKQVNADNDAEVASAIKNGFIFDKGHADYLNDKKDKKRAQEEIDRDKKDADYTKSAIDNQAEFDKNSIIPEFGDTKVTFSSGADGLPEDDKEVTATATSNVEITTADGSVISTITKVAIVENTTLKPKDDKYVAPRMDETKKHDYKKPPLTYEDVERTMIGKETSSTEVNGEVVGTMATGTEFENHDFDPINTKLANEPAYETIKNNPNATPEEMEDAVVDQKFMEADFDATKQQDAINVEHAYDVDRNQPVTMESSNNPLQTVVVSKQDIQLMENNGWELSNQKSSLISSGDNLELSDDGTTQTTAFTSVAQDHTIGMAVVDTSNIEFDDDGKMTSSENSILLQGVDYYESQNLTDALNSGDQSKVLEVANEIQTDYENSPHYVDPEHVVFDDIKAEDKATFEQSEFLSGADADYNELADEMKADEAARVKAGRDYAAGLEIPHMIDGSNALLRPEVEGPKQETPQETATREYDAWQADMKGQGQVLDSQGSYQSSTTDDTYFGVPGERDGPMGGLMDSDEAAEMSTAASAARQELEFINIRNKALDSEEDWIYNGQNMTENMMMMDIENDALNDADMFEIRDDYFAGRKTELEGIIAGKENYQDLDSASTIQNNMEIQSDTDSHLDRLNDDAQRMSSELNIENAAAASNAMQEEVNRAKVNQIVPEVESDMFEDDFSTSGQDNKTFRLEGDKLDNSVKSLKWELDAAVDRNTNFLTKGFVQAGVNREMSQFQDIDRITPEMVDASKNRMEGKMQGRISREEQNFLVSNIDKLAMDAGNYQDAKWTAQSGGNELDAASHTQSMMEQNYNMNYEMPTYKATRIKN
jgi:hypothetical protein